MARRGTERKGVIVCLLRSWIWIALPKPQRSEEEAAPWDKLRVTQAGKYENVWLQELINMSKNITVCWAVVKMLLDPWVKIITEPLRILND